MVNQSFVEALGNLVDVYGRYLSEHQDDEDLLDIHHSLNDILEKLSSHLKKTCPFEDNSTR